MKILQTADFHLKNNAPERLIIFEALIKKACEDNCDMMVICGDLFEDKNSANKLRPKVRNIFNKYEKLNIYLLPGNHDVSSYDAGKVYGQNVRLLNKTPFEIECIEDWYFVFVPFTSQSKFKEILNKIHYNPSRTIMFAHGTLYDDRFSYIYEELEEFAKYMPVFSWEIENKIKYLGLGHFHSYMTKAKFGNTLVAYSGAPISTGNKCMGKRKYLILDLDKNGKFELKDFQINNSPYWRELKFHIYPGKEKSVLDDIEKSFCKFKDPDIMINVKLTGIIDCEEKYFNDELLKLSKKYKEKFTGIRYENLTSGWGNVVKNSIVKKFIEKLGKIKVRDKIKNRALELTLDAFQKSIK